MPVRTYEFRERGSFWPAFLTMLGMVVGLLVVIIALYTVTDGAIDIPTPLLVGLTVGLSGSVLVMFGKKRVVIIGNGWLSVSDGKQELARVALPDIARARIYFKRVRNLELTNRSGHQLLLSPFPASHTPDEIVDYLRVLLPHLEQANPVMKVRKLRHERIIDFPPPRGWNQSGA